MGWCLRNTNTLHVNCIQLFVSFVSLKLVLRGTGLLREEEWSKQQADSTCQDCNQKNWNSRTPLSKSNNVTLPGLNRIDQFQLGLGQRWLDQQISWGNNIIGFAASVVLGRPMWHFYALGKATWSWLPFSNFLASGNKDLRFFHSCCLNRHMDGCSISKKLRAFS